MNGNVLSEAMIFGRKKTEGEDDRIYFTFTEVQEYLSVCRQTMYKLMKSGLVSHKIGKKRVFMKENLVKWLEEN